MVRGGDDPEVEAITSLCQAHRVILDAETFAALAELGHLDTAKTAFRSQIVHVSRTESIFQTDALTHICSQVVHVARYSSLVEPFGDSTALNQRLVLGAQVAEMAKNWDREWDPPRAEPVISSLVAGQTHKIPVVTAYPYAYRLGRPAGGFRVVATPEVAILFAHAKVLSHRECASLAVELGFLTDTRRGNVPSCRADWDAQLPAFRESAAQAAGDLLCPVPWRDAPANRAR